MIIETSGTPSVVRFTLYFSDTGYLTLGRDQTSRCDASKPFGT
jgi:hypothetical protein